VAKKASCLVCGQVSEAKEMERVNKNYICSDCVSLGKHLKDDWKLKR